jgi:hypothetical protein
MIVALMASSLIVKIQVKNTDGSDALPEKKALRIDTVKGGSDRATPLDLKVFFSKRARAWRVNGSYRQLSLPLG